MFPTLAIVNRTSKGIVSTSSFRFLSLHDAKSTAGRLFNASALVVSVEVKDENGNTALSLQKDENGHCVYRFEQHPVFEECEIVTPEQDKYWER